MDPEDLLSSSQHPMVDPVTTQELLSEYDRHGPSAAVNYEHLRNAIELGADINALAGFATPLSSRFSTAVDEANRRHLLDQSEPMLFSEESQPGEGFLPSDLIERMYNELTRRATGMQDGGMVSPDIPQEWLDAVTNAADLYGLPEEILTALITQESSWNPEAISREGAIGLTQVLPSTAQGMLPSYTEQGIATLMQDPIEQIGLGARYLAGLRDRFDGSLPEALAVYNSGPGTYYDPVAGTVDDPRIRYFDETGERQRVYNTAETQNYLLDIIDRARGDEGEMYTRQRSPDRTPEERRALIEERFFAVPGARYEYESDSYIPIRPTMRPVSRP